MSKTTVIDNSHYMNKLRTPPSYALKPITGGYLKGFTSISPAWIIKVLTETFGPYGKGWKLEINKEETTVIKLSEITTITTQEDLEDTTKEKQEYSEIVESVLVTEDSEQNSINNRNTNSTTNKSANNNTEKGSTICTNEEKSNSNTEKGSTICTNEEKSNSNTEDTIEQGKTKTIKTNDKRKKDPTEILSINNTTENNKRKNTKIKTIKEERLFDIEVLLYVKYEGDDDFSAPSLGKGCSKIQVIRNSGGSFVDDEARKKAYTDAIGNAAKFIGVGLDIHMGIHDNKYPTENQTEKFLNIVKGEISKASSIEQLKGLHKSIPEKIFETLLKEEFTKRKNELS